MPVRKALKILLLRTFQRNLDSRARISVIWASSEEALRDWKAELVGACTLQEQMNLELKANIT